MRPLAASRPTKVWLLGCGGARVTETIGDVGRIYFALSRAFAGRLALVALAAYATVWLPRRPIGAGPSLRTDSQPVLAVVAVE